MKSGLERGPLSGREAAQFLEENAENFTELKRVSTERARVFLTEIGYPLEASYDDLKEMKERDPNAFEAMYNELEQEVKLLLGEGEDDVDNSNRYIHKFLNQRLQNLKNMNDAVASEVGTAHEHAAMDDLQKAA